MPVYNSSTCSGAEGRQTIRHKRQYQEDSASMRLRILLVDDHKILLAGIRAILDQSQDFEVIGEAESGAEAIAACKQQHPDVIVMDIGLPDVNGIETTQVILRNAPGTKVVMLSIYCDEYSVVSAIRAGSNRGDSSDFGENAELRDCDKQRPAEADFKWR